MTTTSPDKLAPNVAVIVGRFQVAHLTLGHNHLISSVYNDTSYTKVIVVLGISPLALSRNDPLDFESRRRMILDEYPSVIVLGIKDHRDDRVWSRQLDKMISDIINVQDSVIMCGSRDSFLSAYHGKFHTRVVEECEGCQQSGTDLRRKTASTIINSYDFRSGVIWAAHNQYPIAYQVVDIAVVDRDCNRVLLGKKPTEKQYRFFGGFMDPTKDKSLEDGALRELREEAGHMEVDRPTYHGSTVVNDWRYKNAVNKIFTAFFTVNWVFGAPTAGDDIESVKWFPMVPQTLEHIVPEHHELFNKYILDVDPNQVTATKHK